MIQLHMVDARTKCRSQLVYKLCTKHANMPGPGFIPFMPLVNMAGRFEKFQFISNVLVFKLLVYVSKFVFVFHQKRNMRERKIKQQKNSFLQSAKSCSWLFLLIQFLDPARNVKKIS